MDRRDILKVCKYLRITKLFIPFGASDQTVKLDNDEDAMASFDGMEMCDLIRLINYSYTRSCKSTLKNRYFLQYIDGQHHAISLFLAYTKSAIDIQQKSFVYDQNSKGGDIKFDMRSYDVEFDSNFSKNLNMMMVTPKLNTILTPNKLANTSRSIWASLNSIGEEAIDVLIYLFEACEIEKPFAENNFFHSGFHFNSAKKFIPPWSKDNKKKVSITVCIFIFGNMILMLFFSVFKKYSQEQVF